MLLVGLLLAGLLAGGSAWAGPAGSSLVVTSLADNTVDDDACTLREAIGNANADAQTYDDCAAGSADGSDSITFSVSGTITLSSSLPAITSALIIDGPGADSLTISGNNAVNVLQIGAGTSVVLQDVTIADGADAVMSAVLNQGTLSISGSTLLGNSGTNGGAIVNLGALTISSSTLTGNTASANGGAIYSQGTLSISSSTISGNQAGLDGPAGFGGGIWTDDVASISNSTLSVNTASSGGASIYIVSGGSVSIGGSIVASSSTSNCSGVVIDLGNNLQHPGTSCGAGIREADPKLGPLAGNGGPTMTHVLQADSPALDAGPASGCPAADQRGVARPQDADSNGEPRCDIGAVEMHVDLSISALTPPPSGALPGQPVTFELSYTNLGADTARQLVLQVSPPSDLHDITTSPLLPETSAGWAVPDLAPGASGTIRIQGTVDPTLSADASLALSAQLGGIMESKPADNSAQATLAVVVPRVQLAASAVSAGEGSGSAKIGVSLNKVNPYAPVQVSISRSGGTATATADYSLPGSTSIAKGQTSATLQVALVDDKIDEDNETLVLTLNTLSGAALGSRTSTTLTLADNDSAGISVAPVSGLVTTEDGGSASFTVVLATQPTADVTINLSSSNPDEGSVAPEILRFSAANWSTPRTVTITGVDDTLDDGDIAYSISTSAAASADLKYNGLALPDVSVLNRDLDMRLFLPLLVRPEAPDLVVERLQVVGDDVELVISNNGPGPVMEPFWVDVYIKPTRAPTAVNETWKQLAPEGLVWRVTAGLAAGESLTLKSGGPYYVASESHFLGTQPLGTRVYAQVDSRGTAAYGALQEIHEDLDWDYNNVYGPIPVGPPPSKQAAAPGGASRLFRQR